MALRFHKGFRIFPGVRINLSKTGISTTVGAGPFHLNFGKKGVMATASIPGSGLSHRQFMKIPRHKTDATNQEAETDLHKVEERLPHLPPPLPKPLPADDRVRMEIQSREISDMTSPSLFEVHDLMIVAAAQRREVKDHLVDASMELRSARETLAMSGESCGNGPNLAPEADKASWGKYIAELETYLTWLRSQLDQSSIATELDVSAEVVPLFKNFCQAFKTLSDCDHIWDETASTRRTSDLENQSIRTLEERVSIKCSMENLETLAACRT